MADGDKWSIADGLWLKANADRVQSILLSQSFGLKTWDEASLREELEKAGAVYTSEQVSAIVAELRGSGLLISKS